MRNERGSLTLDFLFAFVLVFGMTLLLFRLTFAFAVVEIVQYMTFASARTYFAGHFDEQTQQNLAVEKFKALQNQKSLKPLFTNGWFKLTVEPNMVREYNQDYQVNPEDTKNFWGTRVRLEMPILTFNIPLYGSTTEEGQNLGANIASFLNREPTAVECINFIRERWNGIQKLTGPRSYGAVKGKSKSDTYHAVDDNGC